MVPLLFKFLHGHFKPRIYTCSDVTRSSNYLKWNRKTMNILFLIQNESYWKIREKIYIFKTLRELKWTLPVYFVRWRNAPSPLFLQRLLLGFLVSRVKTLEVRGIKNSYLCPFPAKYRKNYSRNKIETRICSTNSDFDLLLS